MRELLAILSVLATLAGGCVRSTHPVLKSDQRITDPALLGEWVEAEGKPEAVTVNESAPVKVSISANSDSKHEPEIIVVNPPGAEKMSTVVFTHGGSHKQTPATVCLGQIGKLKIVEFSDPQDHDKGQKEAGYFWAILRRADAKGITADVLNPDWLKAYVADHPKELQVQADEKGNLVMITSSTEELQKFLLAHSDDGGAFMSMYWVRPGATTQPATAPAGGR